MVINKLTVILALFTGFCLYGQNQLGNDIDGEAAGDYSGTSVSLSSDGSIVAIGAYENDGNGTNSGHVRIYQWSGSAWTQKGSDIDGEGSNDYSGYSVSLSSDGSIVAIGAYENDGNGSNSGHVRIYQWSGSAWTQKGSDINGEAASDYSGWSVSLSSDGSIVAIGAIWNDGNGSNSGHVRIYQWNESDWTQKGSDINGEAASDHLGRSVSLSSDGSIVAIGANLNDGNGIASGHVRIYEWSGSAWTQKGSDIDGEAVGDYSGHSVSLSSDGSIIAIGATQLSNGDRAGYVRIYEWNGTAWTQKGSDIDGEAAGDYSGRSVSLSSDGSIVAIGATQIYGNGTNSGHVRIYEWSGSAWTQKGSDINGEAASDYSGDSVSLSSDGSIVAIGALYNDDNGTNSGHVRVFALDQTKPYARNSSVAVTEQVAGTFQLDAGDLNGDSITYSVVTDPSYGTVSIDTNGLATYTSNSDTATSDSFTFKVNDGTVDSNTSTVTITIAAVNDAPTTADVADSTDEDTPVDVTLSGSDVDTGDTLTYSVVTDPSNGTVANNNDGTVTYTPSANYNGTDTFTYKVNDGTVDSNTSTVTITIAAVNDAPTTADVSATVIEGQSFEITLDGSDPDNDALTYSVVTQPANGTVTISGNVATYTSNSGIYTSDSFTYKANDTTVDSSTSTVSITIINQIGNDIDGEASHDSSGYSVSLSSDGSIVAIGAYRNDGNGTNSGHVRIYEWNGSAWTQKGSDIDGEASYDYSSWSVSLSSDGSIVAIGAQHNDGNGSNSGHVRIYEWSGSAWTQKGSDIDGEASDDSSGRSVSLSSDGSIVAIGAPHNDGNGSAAGHVRIYEWNGSAWTQKGSDIDGEAAGDSSGTSVSLSSDGSIVAIGASGNDGNGGSAGHVRIYEWNGSAWTQKGSDIDGEASYDFSGRPVSLSSDGSIVAIGATGNDGNGTDSGHVRIYEWNGSAWTQKGSDIDGEASDDFSGRSVSLSSDGSIVVIGAYNNDGNGTDSGHVRIYEWSGSAWTQKGSDIDGEASYDFSGFSVSLSSDGSIVAIGAYGNDGNGTASGHVRVFALDQTKPYARNSSVAVTEQVTGTFQLDAGDLNGDSITYSVVTDPSYGTVSIDTNGLATYTSNSDTATSDSFTFKVNDGTVDSNTSTVTITIAAVNDAPTTADVADSTDEDTPVDVTLSGSDVDGDDLTYSVVTDPSNGTVANNNDGTVTYTPSANYNGTDTFTYKVNDGTVDSNTSTVTITIAAVNNTPTTADVADSTDEDTPVDVTLNGSDVDTGDTLTYSVVTDPSNGTVANNNDGTVTYTPSANYNGTDTFTYKVNDGTVDSNTSTVTITIAAVNDQPTLTAVSETTSEDTAVEITLTGTDIDQDTLTFSVTDPSNGSVSIDGAVVTYTPNANFNGTDSFTYTANDGTVDSDAATITITVSAVNDQPTLTAVSETTSEDTAVEITLTGTDIDQDTLTFSVTDPSNGSVSIDGAVVTYTPNANFNGTDSFTYTANDGTVDSDAATITITVSAVNDQPTLTAVSETTSEDTAVEITLTGTDIDQDTLTFSVTDPSNGSVSIDGAVVTYTPNANFNGTDSFTYTANDGTVDSDAATITITVSAVNDQPTLTAVSETTSEDTAVEITLTGTDIDQDTLTFSVTDPSNGSVSIDGAVVTYTPNANFNGTDSFTYTANDGTVDSDAATITITVSAVNDQPTLTAVSETTSEDTAVEITLTGTDIDQDTLTFSVTDPSNGSVSIDGAVVTYTPNANFNGTDSFTYTANDGTVDSDAATITITVSAVNDQPTLTAVSETTSEDTAVEITLTGTDIDQDTLTFSVTDPSNGSVSIDGAVVTYTPNANFNGTDSFTYTANDGTVDSDAATITITVSAVNDQPTLTAVSETTSEDTAVEITLTGTDIDQDTLTFSVTDPSNGSVSIDGAVVTYTPNANFNGTDSFTYTANDGTVDSDAATITITVSAVNDTPTTADVADSTDEDTPVDVTLNGSDVDTGDTLTYSVVTDPNNGTVANNNDGTVTYTPSANYNGTDTFTYKVNDGTVDSEFATVTITIEAVNDTPTAAGVADSTDEDTPVDVTLNGSDVDTGDEITYVLVEDPSNGTISIFGDKATYTPNENYNGEDTFLYCVNDGTVDSEFATVTITIEAVNDTPTAEDVTSTTKVNRSARADFSGADVDKDNLTFSVKTKPSNGTITIEGSSFTYTPNDKYVGEDIFTYVTNDGTVDSEAAKVTLTIDDFDHDGDGIPGSIDNCPDTPDGATVDVNGCEVFALPSNTFLVSVTSATCPDSSNGSITISSSNTEYSYRYAIDDQAPVALTDNTQTISNLSAGIYTVCVTVDGVSGYERCYTIEITEPAPLVASSRIDMSSRNMELDLSGSEEYQVTINGKTFLTSKDRLSLNLEPGMNRVEVATTLDCQGVYFEEIFVSEEVKVYPNPTKGPLQLFVAGSDTEVELSITSLSGGVLRRETLSVPMNRIIETSLGNLPEGLYLITLNGTTVKTTHKVIKE